MYKKIFFIFLLSLLCSCQFNTEQRKSPENFFAVIPHHNLVSKEIDEFYKHLSEKYAENTIENVAIISPNHFNFNGLIAETIPENGILCFQKECIEAYTFNSIENKNHFFMPVFRENNGQYQTQEHGIGEHISHIKKYFPNAKFYPLVIRINHKNVKNSALEIEKIISQIKGNTLIIASVDFSHNAEENIAIKRDEETIKKMGEGNLQDAEVDCPNCLQSLYFLARNGEKTCFNMYKRTSSDIALGINTGNENTSHIYGEYEICK